LFSPGIEYYCTIALGVALLVGCSPFYKDEKLGPFLVMGIMIFILANIGFAMGFKSIGSIIDVFMILVFLEWVLYMSWKGGFIIGSLITGLVLYGGALVLESNGRTILNLMMKVGGAG
jgi:hypothetical protein